MTAIDPLTYLDEVDARVGAATERPWGASLSIDHKWVLLLAHSGTAEEARLGKFSVPRDAAFIIGARDDVPRLSKALRGVLAMHIPHTGFGDDPPICRECNRVALGATAEAYYPCPTVQAIQAAIAVNDEGGTT